MYDETYCAAAKHCCKADTRCRNTHLIEGQHNPCGRLGGPVKQQGGGLSGKSLLMQ